MMRVLIPICMFILIQFTQISIYAHPVKPSKFIIYKNYRRDIIIKKDVPLNKAPKCVEDEISECPQAPKEIHEKDEHPEHNKDEHHQPKEKKHKKEDKKVEPQPPSKEEPKPSPPKEEPKVVEQSTPKEEPKIKEPSSSKEPKKEEPPNKGNKPEISECDHCSKPISASEAEIRLSKIKNSVITSSIIGAIFGIVIFIICYSLAYAKYKKQDSKILMVSENNINTKTNTNPDVRISNHG